MRREGPWEEGDGPHPSILAEAVRMPQDTRAGTDKEAEGQLTGWALREVEDIMGAQYTKEAREPAEKMTASSTLVAASGSPVSLAEGRLPVPYREAIRTSSDNTRRARKQNRPAEVC